VDSVEAVIIMYQRRLSAVADPFRRVWRQEKVFGARLVKVGDQPKIAGSLSARVTYV